MVKKRPPVASKRCAGDQALALDAGQVAQPGFEPIPERAPRGIVRIGALGQHEREGQHVIGAEPGIDVPHAIVGTQQQATADQEQRGDRALGADQHP